MKQSFAMQMKALTFWTFVLTEYWTTQDIVRIIRLNNFKCGSSFLGIQQFLNYNFRCRKCLGVRLRPFRSAGKRREQEADKPDQTRLQEDASPGGHRRPDVRHLGRLLPQFGHQSRQTKGLHVGM